MPLNEFTDKAMTGLLTGHSQVPVGMATHVWEHFEKGKLEKVEEIRQRTQQ